MDRINVIIVDDEKAVRDLFIKSLAHLGMTFLSAGDGEEAWHLAQTSGARMIVTDWNMPKMNGVELCRKIRNEIADNYIYIILITAREEKDDIIEGLHSGADDFIVKPVNLGELTARVKSGLRVIQLEDDYRNACTQLFQSEKMSSVGQLAAGIAHEINNPTGYVSSNLKSLSDYQQDVKRLLTRYHSLIKEIRESFDPEMLSKILGSIEAVEGMERDMDIDFLVEDGIQLLNESRDGLERIKRIVQDLKDFAHPGEESLSLTDIHGCLETTLNVIANEIKYKAEVIKKFNPIPTLMGYPQQLNQVFMNILINAVQAMDKSGTIEIETSCENDMVVVRIRDNGKGISKEHIHRIFDPFFTTKDVGKGTGLGMHVAYTIVMKHHGSIDVESEPGRGTRFTIRLPLNLEPLPDDA